MCCNRLIFWGFGGQQGVFFPFPRKLTWTFWPHFCLCCRCFRMQKKFSVLSTTISMCMLGKSTMGSLYRKSRYKKWLDIEVQMSDKATLLLLNWFTLYRQKCPIRFCENFHQLPKMSTPWPVSRYNEDLRAIEGRVGSGLMASEYIVLNTDGHGIQMRNFSKQGEHRRKSMKQGKWSNILQLAENPNVGP